MQMVALAPSELGLRVAIVIGGRIVDERVLRKGRLGVARASIVEHDAPNALVRFERDRRGWRATFAPSARGKLALERDPVELDGARREARLPAGARGRIATGEGAILFQLVALPPKQPRPELPLAVRTRAVDLDWPTTVIGAFSFLVHFLGLGMLYSDWTDPVLDGEAVVSGLTDSIRTLPKPPEVEMPSPDPASPSTAKSGADDKPKKSSGPSRTNATSSGATSSATLKNELEQMEMRTIAALGSERAATADVLRGSEVPTQILDRAAAQNTGVSSGSLNLRSGGPVRPGSETSLGDLGTRSLTTNERRSESVVVTGPRTETLVSPPTTTGRVSDAARVVAGLRPGFRHCYQRAINDYPDAEGSIRLTLNVGPNGEVSSVGASPSGNVPGSLVSCVVARARMAAFDSQDGSASLVVVPVTFKKNR